MDIRRLSGTIRTGIAVCALLSVAAIAGAQTAVKIASTSGQVLVQQPNAAGFVAARNGTLVQVGGRIRTTRQARCDVRFPDGAVVRMGERSDLVIREALGEDGRGRLYAQLVCGAARKVQGGGGTAAVKGLNDGPTQQEPMVAQVTVEAGPVDIVVEGGATGLQPDSKPSESVASVLGMNAPQAPETSLLSPAGQDIQVDSAYVAGTLGDAVVSIGRQRYADANGSLAKRGLWQASGLYDGVRIRQQVGNTLNLDVAYMMDASPLTDDKSQGWIIRAQMEGLGGALGVNYFERDGAGAAFLLDASYPVISNMLTVYGEYGGDPEGNRLSMLGMYFPWLYDSHGIDLYLEHSSHEGQPAVTTATVYGGVSTDLKGIAKVTKEDGAPWEIEAGIVKTLGESSDETAPPQTPDPAPQ